jgi:phage tail sheath protein FI
VTPGLSREQMSIETGGLSLPERCSILGPTPDGLRLLSDVTTAGNETYRPAAVNRLVSVIVRAARRLGEDSAFEPSSESTWADVRGRLGELLRALFRTGALQGATAPDAFQVRCDRSTMSQADIDNGRIIAEIEFQAAAPVERLIVVLALDEGGPVSLISPPATATGAA